MCNFNPAAVRAIAKGDIENAIVASKPGGIERQEAAGQAKAVQQQKLPIKGTFHNRPEWEALGFVFGERDSDGLFVNVTFPEGWKLKRTDHSMWTDLFDEAGKKRASMFYKAAFYDTDAFIRFEK